MVSKNSLPISCLIQSVIRSLFVGIYGVFLSLVIPDEKKTIASAVKIGSVNKSTVVFKIASSVYLFPEHQFL